MKKITLLLVALAAQINSAQNTFPSTGNAGVGTTSPTSVMEIQVTEESKPGGVVAPTKSVFKFSRYGTFGYSYNENAEFRIGHGGSSVYGSKLDLYINGGSNTNSIPDQHVMTWNYNGNVGVGTVNPLFKLDVNGGGHFLVPDDKSVVGGLTIETINGTNLKIGGNSTYSWIQSHASLPLYINELGNNTILNNNTGNVGIGTNAPMQKLTIVGSQNSIDEGAPSNGQNSTAILRLQSSPNGAGEVLDFGMNIKSYGWIQPQDFNVSNVFYNLILNAKGGNVGIGTTAPTAKLHVNNGDNSYGTILANASESAFSLYAKSLNTQVLAESFRLGLKHDNNEDNGFISFYRGASVNGGFLGFSTNGAERVRINSDGNVGIGTTATGSHKLAVEGSVGAREVKVYATAWSDFVFKKEYTLPTLEEVEKHIKEKGHLENIPSEKEVLKDGINLGEMNAKLLQKIEELTLYMIELKKENQNLKDNQKVLEKRILKIENK